MKNNKGFTLVELLAVITILGIIMIVVLPTAFSTISKSRRKLNEYTRNSIEDTARMYFKDIIDKVDPSTKFYQINNTDKFVSNVTGKIYNGATATDSSARMYGYDFVVYALYKQGDGSKFKDYTYKDATPGEEYSYADGRINKMEDYIYGGVNVFSAASNGFNLTRDVNYGSSAAEYCSDKSCPIVISMKDMVKAGYYETECIYAGEKIKEYVDGVEKEVVTMEDHNCSIPADCQVQLQLITKKESTADTYTVMDIQTKIIDEGKCELQR